MKSPATSAVQNGVSRVAISATRTPGTPVRSGTPGFDRPDVFADRSVVPAKLSVSDRLPNATTVPLGEAHRRR